MICTSREMLGKQSLEKLEAEHARCIEAHEEGKLCTKSRKKKKGTATKWALLRTKPASRENSGHIIKTKVRHFIKRKLKQAKKQAAILTILVCKPAPLCMCSTDVFH